MHWLLVSADHHPDHGGIGSHVAAFTAAAVARGWRVDLVTRRGEDYPDGARVHAVGCEDQARSFVDRLDVLRRIDRVRPYRFGLWSLAVASALLEIDDRPDVVEFVDCRAEGWVALHSEAVRRRLHGSRLLVRAHTPLFVAERIVGSEPSRFGRSIYHRWERETLAAADGVIASSAVQVEQLECPWPVPVVPNPVEERAAVPAAAGEQIVVVGGCQPLKGTETWARSLNAVLRRRPRASAMLLGPDTPTGPGGSSMQRHCRSIIDEDLRSRFCCAGAVRHERVLEAIASAAVVVVPSLYESFSYVAAEAIVRERPVVITTRVGIGEHVSGLVRVAPGDVDELAEAQVAHLADRGAAAARARAAREELLYACDPGRHLDRCRAYVESLPASAPRSSGPEGDGIDRMVDFLEGVRAHEAMAELGVAPWRTGRNREHAGAGVAAS